MTNQLKKLLIFKTKLSILFVSFIFLISCSNNILKRSHKYQVSYIGGEFEGLFFSTQLKNSLVINKFYNYDSQYTINASISHSGEIFITNIDNTSDRERINSSIDVNIYDRKNECSVGKFEDSISQFYLIASSTYFESNNFAKTEIKEQNSEELINLFIDYLIDLESVNLKCIKDE